MSIIIIIIIIIVAVVVVVVVVVVVYEVVLRSYWPRQEENDPVGIQEIITHLR